MCRRVCLEIIPHVCILKLPWELKWYQCRVLGNEGILCYFKVGHWSTNGKHNEPFAGIHANRMTVMSRVGWKMLNEQLHRVCVIWECASVLTAHRHVEMYMLYGLVCHYTSRIVCFSLFVSNFNFIPSSIFSQHCGISVLIFKLRYYRLLWNSECLATT